MSEHNGSQAAERNRNSSRVPTLEDLENYRPDADYDTPQPTKRPRQNGRQNGRRAAAVPAVPYDPDIERAALAAAILDPTGEVAAAVEPKLFLSDHHRKIATHLRHIEKPDLTLLVASLRDADELEDIGGWPALEAIVKGVGTFADWPYYVNKLRSYWADRCRLEAITDAQANPSRETAKALQQRLAEIEAAEQANADELKLTPASQLQGEAAVPWWWYGYAAPGVITLLVGLWKAGKTTLLSHLLAATHRGGIVAGEVLPINVLVVSEESQGKWIQRRDQLGIGDNVYFLPGSPFGNVRPSQDQWEQFTQAVAQTVQRQRLHAVIIDPWQSFSPCQDENNSMEMMAALLPLRNITEAGASVLLVHHPGKAETSEGRASRGSGALPGFVDVILELRRYAPNDLEDTRRVLAGLSRFDETPREVVLELTADGYRTLGSKSEVKAQDQAYEDWGAVEEAKGAILAAIEAIGPASKTAIANETKSAGCGRNSKRFDAAFDALLAEGVIETCEIETGNRKGIGYRSVGSALPTVITDQESVSSNAPYL